MVENWRSVPGFQSLYAVSDRGAIKSVAMFRYYNHWRTGARLLRRVSERRVSQQAINSGYSIVHLYKNNRRTALLVHRVVAEAFLGACPAGLEVNHKNGDKSDNRLMNLEYVTRRDNHLHAVAIRLNRQAIPVITPCGKHYDSISQAANDFGKIARRFERAA